MRTYRQVLMVAVFLLACCSLPLHAQITNGSFEIPAVTPGFYSDFGNGSTGITGWTVVGSGGDVAVVSGTFSQSGINFPAEDGKQWLDLTGVSANSTEGVEQTVATTMGTPYALSFWVGNVNDPVNDPKGLFGTTSTVNVYLGGVGGTLLGTFINSNTATGTQTWEQFTPTFTASGSSTTIDFINEDPSTDNTNGLDNVSLFATPEPNTMILFCTGLLCILGAALCRKRFA